MGREGILRAESGLRMAGTSLVSNDREGYLPKRTTYNICLRIRAKVLQEKPGLSEVYQGGICQGR